MTAASAAKRRFVGWVAAEGIDSDVRLVADKTGAPESESDVNLVSADEIALSGEADEEGSVRAFFSFGGSPRFSRSFAASARIRARTVPAFAAEGNYEAMVLTCIDPRKLDRSFAGRTFDDALLNDLPPGIDPCGENGEFHSFAFDGPMFNHPIPIRLGDVATVLVQAGTLSKRPPTAFPIGTLMFAPGAIGRRRHQRG